MRAIGYRKASPELDHLEAFDIPRPSRKVATCSSRCARSRSIPSTTRWRAAGARAAPADTDAIKVVGYDAAGVVVETGPRGEALQAGRRSVLRRQRRPPGREHGVSSGRRADRRAQAAHARFRRSCGFALDLDHGLGGDVRPARCRETRSRRGARDPDPRRRRRRRFDRHPTGAAIDRSYDRGDRLAARDRAMGEGHGRPPCRRPQEAACATDRGARPGQPRLSSSRRRRLPASSPTSPN